MSERKHSVMNSGIKTRLGSGRGFTMAETMVTIAIIIILAGIAFIAVTNYQRSAAQKERDAIAREIFISAQNHLTMSRGVGYLDATEAGGEDQTVNLGYTDNYDSDGSNSNAHYFVVSSGDAFTDDNSTIIDYMLPFGSIDEGVRTGDSYIIRYQLETAEVLDVFYCTQNDSPAKFNHTLTNEEYATVMSLAGDDRKSARRKFDEGSVLGWYGGDDLQNLGAIFKAPVLDVKNGDKLIVTVTDINTSDSKAQIKLVITGLLSGAKKGISLETMRESAADRLSSTTNPAGNTVYEYVLDDITTAGHHFSDLGEDTASADDDKDKRFIPGEDIKIEAVAYSNEFLANLAYSDPVSDNSLYESISDYDESLAFGGSDSKVAYIANIRHLENLDEDVSRTGYTSKVTSLTSGKSLTFVAARQTKDLDLDTFVNGGNNTIYTSGAGSATAHYHPVSYDEPLEYDGLRHSISNIDSNFADNAGLFGTTTASSVIKNLELINFDIASTGNAGALAGTLNTTDVVNVVAYNTRDFDDSRTWTGTNSVSPTIHGNQSAGGLAGVMSGGVMERSAASFVVKGDNYAGGLIGRIDSGEGSAATLTACYSGGHTYDATYHYSNGEDLYSVISEGGASGGLIGAAGGASISACYSTCSAYGAASSTGGLVGTASGTINNCYATGLVNGTYAFIGSGGAGVSNSLYYELINEESEEGSDGDYKGAGTAGAEALDEDADSYDSFVKGRGTWNDAATYDRTVDDFYDGRFNFRTVTQLAATGAKSRIEGSSSPSDAGWYFVNIHHGDWPAAEMVFVNQ